MARGYYPRIASLVAQEQCVVVLCEVVVVKFGGTDAHRAASMAALPLGWGEGHCPPRLPACAFPGEVVIVSPGG